MLAYGGTSVFSLTSLGNLVKSLLWEGFVEQLSLDMECFIAWKNHLSCIEKQSNVEVMNLSCHLCM